MGVSKFRTFAEAREALWLPAGDPGIADRMKRLAELAHDRPVPRGVRRFRTIEEAKAWKANQPRSRGFEPTGESE